MKKIIVLLVMVFVVTKSWSQTGKAPCSDSVYHQLDFWVGEWEAFGINGKKAGDSRIERILGTCIIEENWKSTAVTQGFQYEGKSFNTFNSATHNWQQYWVDNAGGVTDYTTGHYENGKMIFETVIVKQPDGTQQQQRLTFFNLGPDKVRQLGETSTDAGETWKTNYDLEYRRKK
ncbi:MAG: hypothetical protein JSU05_06130 [Bacteroidetes bacterium]|nr:hypothetical protein [Bacteroidota bacterium]